VNCMVVQPQISDGLQERKVHLDICRAVQLSNSPVRGIVFHLEVPSILRVVVHKSNSEVPY